MKAFGYHHSVSGITQYKLCRLLQDKGTKQDLRIASWLDFMAVGIAGFSGLGGVSSMCSINLKICSLSEVNLWRTG